MALNNTDILTLTKRLIEKYKLSSFADAESTVKAAVELADLQLETKFPDYYVPNLLGTTLNNKLFVQAREAYAVCMLFTNNLDYWNKYYQSQNIQEVKNSAGTSVSYQMGKSAKMEIKEFCKQAHDLLKEIGAVKNTSRTAFQQATNKLV